MNSVFAIAMISLSCALSAALTWRFIHPGSFFHVLDHPNERSLHEHPVPRSGGVAIVTAWLVTAFMAIQGAGEAVAPAPWIIAGVLGLALVSFAEDRYGVPRRYRLLAHLLAASLLLLAGLAPEQVRVGALGLAVAPLLALPLTLLFGVWMTNLFNFMDGMDGFAGGMGVVGFATLAAAGWLAPEPGFALVSSVAAAACAGFLPWNFPQASIFMGDAGSTALGFLAAALTLWAAREGILPLWASLLVFSPFIVDASVTLLRRLLGGERIWQAHRSHYYQRLVGLGWSHRKTVLRAYLLMSACAATALQNRHQPAGQVIWLLGMWSAVYVLIAYKVHLLERRAGVAAR